MVEQNQHDSEQESKIIQSILSGAASMIEELIEQDKNKADNADS